MSTYAYRQWLALARLGYHYETTGHMVKGPLSCPVPRGERRVARLSVQQARHEAADPHCSCATCLDALDEPCGHTVIADARTDASVECRLPVGHAGDHEYSSQN